MTDHENVERYAPAVTALEQERAALVRRLREHEDRGATEADLRRRVDQEQRMQADRAKSEAENLAAQNEVLREQVAELDAREAERAEAPAEAVDTGEQLHDETNEIDTEDHK